ncbi:MAG TPA: MarR family transcriptional regulator [Thermoanaerobaculaceae bacterium]|nr:MarR family transcriptional regulator [Thermoanaerobaculaceae bacterium]HPS80013.1 MarR family transcriptional regulator [Thermoanaerobaculaceae bacterium]
MGSHHWGRDDEREALDTYVKLMRAAESVTALLLPRLAAAGLTMGQFGVLEALHHLGPLAQHELAGKLLRSSGNVSVVIDNLERAGLVQRARRPEDRREVIVSLTNAGTALIGELFPLHAVALTEAMSALGPSDQRELGRLCRTLGLSARARLLALDPEVGRARAPRTRRLPRHEVEAEPRVAI